jgi:tetratricopeptide (TPR) repeat protein
MIITVVFSTFLILLKIKHWTSHPKKVLRFTGLIAIMAIISIGFAMHSSITDTIKKQLHFFENPYYGSANERLKLWEFSLEEMRQHPMQGLGGNNWGIMAMKHDASSVRPEVEQGTQVFFQRPHNDFIWKYCETGFWGLLAFALMFFLVFFVLIKKYISSRDKTTSQVALVLLSLIIGFLVFSSFSFPDERPMLKVLFMIALSLVVVCCGKPITASRYFLPVLFLLQLLILPSALLKLQSAKDNYRMQKARMDQNYEEVTKYANKAVNKICNLDDVATPFQYYAAEAFLFQGKQQKAEKNFLDALHANPNHPYILKGLGQIKCDKEQYQLAQKYFSQALENDPSFDLCRMQYAVCLKNMNNIYAAIDQLRLLKDSAWIKASAPMLSRWLPAACWKRAQTIKNEDIRKVLLRMEKNPQWLESIFQKSRANNTDFGDQLILDAIFLLKSEGKLSESNALVIHRQQLRKSEQD